MATKQLLITYYSGTGNTERMAAEIAHGAEGLGVAVKVKAIEYCKLNDLDEADGIVVGSPTYFSNVAWQVKKLIDESIALYRRGRQLRDKVGGCFTSSGTRRDGEDCIRMLELAFGLHHKLKMVPGVIRASGDSLDDVSKMCQEYGMRIAKEVVEQNYGYQKALILKRLTKRIELSGHFREYNFKRWLDNHASEALVELGVKRGQVVLDFGCGSSTYTIPAAKFVGESGSIYALDKSGRSLDRMEKKANLASQWRSVRNEARELVDKLLSGEIKGFIVSDESGRETQTGSLSPSPTSQSAQ